MKILLIDDDIDDQALFCDALKLIDEKISCDLANNGLEAVAKLQSYTILPDLVFLDINMPIMNGRETLKVIKEDARYHAMRVLIYSTSNTQSDIDWFRRYNVDYLVKPDSFDRLRQLLTQQIQNVKHERHGKFEEQLRINNNYAH